MNIVGASPITVPLLPAERVSARSAREIDTPSCNSMESQGFNG